MSESFSNLLDERIRRLQRQAEDLKKEVRSARVPLPGAMPEKSAAPVQQEAVSANPDAQNDPRHPSPPAPKPAAIRPDRKPAPVNPPLKKAPVPPPRNGLSGDYRLASYMSTQGFVPQRGAQQDRSIQRNKAIVLLVLVAVVAYVLYALMF